MFDIGAQVGQYSLFAAKLGHHVLAVEPFEDNILRIHKAVHMENLQDKVILIKNALSHKRNDILLLEKDKQNVGGQTLLNENNINKIKYSRSEMATNKYLVETIFMDDLIDYIPLNKYGKRYEKAVIKIDIEGFEPFAFDKCKKLFETYNVQMIFMELVVLKDKQQLLEDYFNRMLAFLYSSKLEPFSVDNNPLARKTKFDDNVEWPRDVIWRKKL